MTMLELTRSLSRRKKLMKTGRPSLSPRRMPPSSEIWENTQGKQAATVLLEIPRDSLTMGSRAVIWEPMKACT